MQIKRKLLIGTVSIITIGIIGFGLSNNIIAQPVDQQIPVTSSESLTPEAPNNAVEPSGIDPELGTIQESDVKNTEPALRVEGNGEWKVPDENGNSVSSASVDNLILPKLVAPTIPIISINLLFPPDSFIANAEKKISRDIKGTSVLMGGINRETGYSLKFRVPVGTSVNFEGLNVKVSGCYHSHPEDPLESWAYVDILENNLDAKQQIAVIPPRDRQRRKQAQEFAMIKHGWIMASSPNVTPIDHPIYDVWLMSCDGGIIPQTTIVNDVGKPTKAKVKKADVKTEAVQTVAPVEAVAQPVEDKSKAPSEVK